MTKNQPLDVESPFRDDSSILVDMTKHTGLTEPAQDTVRVELRRVKEQVLQDSGPETRAVEESFVIGVIAKDSLPIEGQVFQMPYHALSGNAGFGVGAITDYGRIDTVAGISGLVVVDGTYFFETAEGTWRLSVLDSGN